MNTAKEISMKAKTHISLAFALISLLSINILAKDTWVKVNSKNFELMGNASEKDIRRVATKLEQFREVFSRLFGRMKFNSPIPTKVIVFKSQSSFTPYKPLNAQGKATKWVAGYFLPTEDMNYITLTTEGEDTDTFETIYHEYLHFLVDNNLGKSNIPPWLNEGIAEFYETFQIEEDQKVYLGNLNNSHLQLLQQNKLIPLETFFNIDRYSLRQQGSDGAGLFYAQAWSFIHYMMLGSDVRQKQLNKFIDLILTGKPQKEAFFEAFQSDYATIEKELRKYTEQTTFKGLVKTFPDKLLFDSEMTSAPLSEAMAKASLGDLLYRNNRYDEATAHLQQALALEPNLSTALTSLGLVKLRQNNLPEARKYLELAITNGADNYLAHYQYAYLLSRTDMSEYGFVSGYSGEYAEKMYESLKKAISLKPDFSKSYELYAFICVVRNEKLDEAINYLKLAIKLAPGDEWILMRMAEIFMRQEKFADARKYAQSVFQNAGDENVRLYAQNTINRIDSTEAQLEQIKNYKNRPQPFEVTDAPKSEEEIAKLRNQAMLESLNSIIRQPGAGEERVVGQISRIDCVSGQIYFTVKAEGGIFKLQTASFQGLNLMAYNVPMEGVSIGCGGNMSKQTSVVTYKAIKDPKGKIAGEIISIEFVPAGFRLAK